MAFLVIFWLGLGTPAILRQNPNKLSFGQFRKKVGIGSDPRPPPWAKFPTFTENLFCKLPLIDAKLKHFSIISFFFIDAHFDTEESLFFIDNLCTLPLNKEVKAFLLRLC